MRHGNRLGDGQPEPGTIANRIIGAIKALEHQINLVCGNPAALIDALDDTTGVVLCIRDSYCLLGLTMANGVFDDI